jgi:UDP-N-acetylmuramoylalanine--D-glutamate ligase
VAEALLIGRDAPSFAATLAAHGVAHRIVGSLAEAVPRARDAARAHGADTVLLSPACASFDQFSGFEERGAAFTALVRALPGGGG